MYKSALYIVCDTKNNSIVKFIRFLKIISRNYTYQNSNCVVRIRLQLWYKMFRYEQKIQLLSREMVQRENIVRCCVMPRYFKWFLMSCADNKNLFNMSSHINVKIYVINISNCNTFLKDSANAGYIFISIKKTTLEFLVWTHFFIFIPFCGILYDFLYNKRFRFIISVLNIKQLWGLWSIPNSIRRPRFDLWSDNISYWSSEPYV